MLGRVMSLKPTALPRPDPALHELRLIARSVLTVHLERARIHQFVTQIGII